MIWNTFKGVTLFPVKIELVKTLDGSRLRKHITQKHKHTRKKRGKKHVLLEMSGITFIRHA
jgi:hypothetical protein